MTAALADGALAPEQVAAQLDAARERLAAGWPDAGSVVSVADHVADYVAALDAWPADRAYHRPPDTAVAYRDALAARGGPPLVAAFHRVVLATLVRRVCGWLVDGVPDSAPNARTVRFLLAEPNDFVVSLASLAGELSELPDEKLDYGHDSFRKDLNVCLVRVAIGGARIIELRSGLSRSLLAGPPAARLRALAVIARMGGTRPLLEGHVYARRLTVFDEDGNVASWLRFAAALRHDPSVRGGFGNAWYYDPTVPVISPRLAYLRALPLENGASFVEVPIDPAAVRSAISKSSTRRRLYEAGEYRPRSFAVVWPRRALLRWADGVSSAG